MLPPAPPARFSTITVWLSLLPRRCARWRAIASVLAPGGTGTTILISFEG